MSLQFSRSMRILRLDSFRAARVGLALAAVNMFVLVLWFFLARVTIYEISSSIQFTLDPLEPEPRLTATFPKESMTRIHSGQSAWLRLENGSDGQASKLPAMVYEVPPDGNKAVLVVLAPDFNRNLNAERLKGQVEVEVDYVTPAALVMRSTSQILNNRNQVPVSPQNNEGRNSD